MSTHNIYFRGEIRKISEHFSDEKSALSVAAMQIRKILVLFD